MIKAVYLGLLMPGLLAAAGNSSGQWGYGMQERNIRNLWRILNEEQPAQASQKEP